MIKFSIPIFFFTFSYTTGLSKISCQISIYYEQYNSCFLDLISENLRLPLIFFVPSLGWKLEKMTSFSQKYHMGWNYKNNICIEVRIRITKALAHKFVQFSTLISNYWMRLSRIWRILQVEESVIHRGRKPNSIIVLLFIQNIIFAQTF